MILWTHHHRVGLAWQGEVVGVPALTGYEAQIFFASYGPANSGGACTFFSHP